MSIKKILVAVDFTERPEDIMEKALSHLICDEAEIYIIHVIQDISGLSMYSDAYIAWEQYREIASRDTIIALNPYVKTLSSRFSDIHPVVEIGDPAEEITSLAEKLGADMIIVGNHCRGGIKHLLHRNVAEKVMRLSKRDVFSFFVGEPASRD